ncbi:unnamed protein product [Rhodiola kirilowii]
MGRGRTPCCDKSQVIKGPCTPAEGLMLAAFIQKHWHDNWRALPKKAGLLRCGKSCRLRWVNYLRPDLKLGNYSKDEEETILLLQQSIANKYDFITAITSIKRLAKEAPEPKQDEASVIKLSSSPSTVETNPNNQKLDTESHIKLLPRERSPMKTDETKSPIRTTNSSGTDDVEQFIIWEDQNLLESLLNEVDDPNWVLAPQNTQNESTENTSFHELPMESDIDLWSMMNAPHEYINDKDNDHKHKHLVEASMNTKSMNAPHEYINGKDNDSIFQYLENEPGLDQLSMEVCQQPKQQHGDDVNQNRFAVPGMNDFPMPQSSLYFSVTNTLGPADPFIWE